MAEGLRRYMKHSQITGVKPGAHGATSIYASVELMMVTAEAEDVQTPHNSSHVPSRERVDGERNSHMFPHIHISPHSKEKQATESAVEHPPPPTGAVIAGLCPNCP